MKKCTIALLAVIMIFSIAGCGDTVSTGPNAGIYTATGVEMSGFELDVSVAFPEGFTIELKDKEKCALNISGEKANGKWTLDGDAISISGGGAELDGTLEDGTMNLTDVMGSGMNVTLSKGGE